MVFTNLTNLSYQRNKKEAIGFYITYLVITILLGTIISAIVGVIVGHSSFSLGIKIATLTALVVSVALSFLVIKRKKVTDNYGYIILALLSGVLALLGGGILGLIPTTYLSTRKSSIK
jgi:hypothetical protein